MKRNIQFAVFFILLVVLSSCSSQGWNYPDYEYQGVYFAYQYPVRTIVLGESQFDTELDNMHQFKIMATTSGVYENNNDVMVDFEIDNSMVDGFLFNSADGDSIQPMPDNYYDLMSNQIIIPRGELAGGVKVQLTDAFFDDPDALKKTYVIPVKLTNVANADSILSGEPKETVDNPRRGVGADWNVLPMDFTFYAVKYINHLDGFYLRRGMDEITRNNATTETMVRHADYVVDDQVVELNTESLHKIAFPINYSNSEGQDVPVTLILQFDEEGNITISDNSGDYSVTGDGTFIKDGAKDSWGGKDRNVIYLDYKVDVNNMHIETADTLVLRDRGVSMETFTPFLQ